MFSNKAVLPVIFSLAAACSALAAVEPVAVDLYAGPALANGQPFDLSTYYPVKIGDYWKYQDTAANDVQFKLEIKQQVTVNGRQAFKFERNTFVETDSISTDADGMLLHAQERTQPNGSVIATAYTPPVKFAALQTKVGDRCVSIPGFINPGTGNTMTWTSTVQNVQDVTVPAGKFTNCVHIKVLVADTKLGVKLSDFEMWVAKGVGVVKRQGNFFGTYFVQNLLEWKLAK